MIVIDRDTGREFDLRRTDELSADQNAIYFERCPHERAELRKRTTSNGRVSYWHQCLSCGSTKNGSHGAVPKSQVVAPSMVPDWDDRIAKAYQAERSRRLAEVEQKHVRLQKADKAEWWKWYDGYLKSTAWRLKRNLVMARAEGVCEGCREREATQVHHLTYDHVGDEFLFELVAICARCHERMHSEGKQRSAA